MRHWYHVVEVSNIEFSCKHYKENNKIVRELVSMLYGDVNKNF